MTEEEFYLREDVAHGLTGIPVILVNSSGRIGNQWHDFKWRLNRLFENANPESSVSNATGRVSGQRVPAKT